MLLFEEVIYVRVSCLEVRPNSGRTILRGSNNHLYAIAWNDDFKMTLFLVERNVVMYIERLFKTFPL